MWQRATAVANEVDVLNWGVDSLAMPMQGRIGIISGSSWRQAIIFSRTTSHRVSGFPPKVVVEPPPDTHSGGTLFVVSCTRIVSSGLSCSFLAHDFAAGSCHCFLGLCSRAHGLSAISCGFAWGCQLPVSQRCGCRSGFLGV